MNENFVEKKEGRGIDFFVVGIFVFFAAFYIGFRYFYVEGSFAPTLVFKTLSSLCFLVFAFYNYFKNKDKSGKYKRYSVKLLAALSISFVADIFIKLSVLSGIAIFLFAQVFYFLAFLEFKKLSLKYFVLVFVTASAIIIFDLLCPLFDLRDLSVPLGVYAFFVVGSALKSIDALSFENKFSRVVMVATFLGKTTKL